MQGCGILCLTSGFEGQACWILNLGRGTEVKGAFGFAAVNVLQGLDMQGCRFWVCARGLR